MKQEVVLGKITKVMWHYIEFHVSGMGGHLRDCFDESRYHTDDTNRMQLDDALDPEKFYANVVVTDKQFVVRNLISLDNDKNYFFEDKFIDHLFLEDELGLLEEYVKLRGTKLEDKVFFGMKDVAPEDILYYRVEYEPVFVPYVKLCIHYDNMAREVKKIKDTNHKHLDALKTLESIRANQA